MMIWRPWQNYAATAAMYSKDAAFRSRTDRRSNTTKTHGKVGDNLQITKAITSTEPWSLKLRFLDGPKLCAVNDPKSTAKTHYPAHGDAEQIASNGVLHWARQAPLGLRTCQSVRRVQNRSDKLDRVHVYVYGYTDSVYVRQAGIQTEVECEINFPKRLSSQSVRNDIDFGISCGCFLLRTAAHNCPIKMLSSFYVYLTLPKCMAHNFLEINTFLLFAGNLLTLLRANRNAARRHLYPFLSLFFNSENKL